MSAAAMRAVAAAIAVFAAAAPAAAETAAADAALVIWAGETEVLRFPPGSITAEPTLDMAGRPAVSFRMDADTARAFLDLTAHHIGDVIELRLCGKTISAPRVIEAIGGGTGLIAGDFTAAETAEIAQRITTSDCSETLAPPAAGPAEPKSRNPRRGGGAAAAPGR